MPPIRVAFDNQTYPLEDVLEFPARYVRGLENARKLVGWAECRCAQQNKPLRLVIRKYGQLFYRAGWPDDGHRHDRACPFHKVGTIQTSRTAPPDAAIRKVANGLNVRLDVVFEPASGTPQARDPTTHDATAVRTARRSASLLAFLKSLWAEARLNGWSPAAGNRNWGYCNTALVEAVGEGPINGEQADRVLHVMRRFEQENGQAINDELNRFLAALASADGQAPSRRGLILGEVAEVAPSKYGHIIALRQNRRRYYADSRLIEKVGSSYRFAYAAIGQKHARVVTLMLVDMKKGYARVIDACLMLCSPAFVPCDSSFEVAMANRLTREHRAFEKPLSPNNEEILPDFVLTDTRELVEIEVYGLNGHADYELRKREKQAIRARKGIQCVEWNTDRVPLDDIVIPEPFNGDVR